MAPVEPPSHFVRDRDAVTVFTVAQKVAKYTNREVQVAVLAKQFIERMGIMSFRDAFDVAHHGMNEDSPVSSHDLYGETAI